MATYYIDGNAGNDSANGSSSAPWKTLAKAEGRVQPGDEVRIRTATYRETLTIKVRNTTWKADTGQKPILDGRYHDGLFRPDGTLPHPDPSAGYLPTSENGSMVLLREDGITLDGITVQNCAGAGIAVTGSNCTIRNCRVDFTYITSIRVNPGASFIDNVVLENNICTRSSVTYYDPQRTGDSPQNVSGVIKMGRTRDGIIRNNICAFGHGEGINVGKGSYRTIVEGNIVHTCNHVHIYINRSIDVIVRNNLVYHLYTKDYLGVNERPPTAIVIGDENTKSDSWPNSAGGEIYNNIVVGLGTLFGVRNGKNYNTQLDKCYVGYNTFIGGSLTELGVQIGANLYNRPHRNSLFENNIIFNAPRMSQAGGAISGITFRNNLWGEQPDQAMRGPNDRIGNPNLVNPTAKIEGKFPDPSTNIDPRNYQLTSRSSLAIDMAGDSDPISGLQPPAVHKDFYGATRDSKPDIGAHEYAGTITEVTANFSIGPGQASGALPHTVDFTDKSASARPIVSRLWDFGDGQTSTETNPSHTYESAGSFDVSLTVTDDGGNSDTLKLTGLITVAQVPDTIIPDSFRRFVLSQVADQAILAFGTQYPDLRCILIWNDVPFHILNYADVEDVKRSAFNEGTTELMWIDPSYQDDLLGPNTDTIPADESEATPVP